MRSVWILGNHRSPEPAMLKDVKEDDVIVMIEATSRAT